MNKKFLLGICTLVTIFSMIMTSMVYATMNDVTLEEAENNVCQINLGNDGKVIKKLISVDDSNKEATLQVDATNLNTDAETIMPSEIFLVIDNSASMSDNTLSDGTTRKAAISNAAKTLTNNILQAQKETKIGVVSFATSSNPGTLQDATLETKPTSDANTVLKAIDGITQTGNTDIDAGLQVARSNFDTNNVLKKYIILLTDGLPNAAIGMPQETYTAEADAPTKATLKSLIDNGISVITVMTGVTADEQVLAEDVFGTETKPNYGKIYYVTDDKASQTITNDVYSDTLVKRENTIKNMTITDYFPDDIIANYDFSIVDKANIGNVTEAVDTKNNSITWTIDKLDANQTASFKYKLKLKDNYNTAIINQIMPTNKKVDVTYTGTDSKTATQTSDVSPKIILKGDKTVATTEIPKTGDMVCYIVAAIIIFTLIGIYYYKRNNKIK